GQPSNMGLTDSLSINPKQTTLREESTAGHQEERGEPITPSFNGRRAPVIRKRILPHHNVTVLVEHAENSRPVVVGYIAFVAVKEYERNTALIVYGEASAVIFFPEISNPHQNP